MPAALLMAAATLLHDLSIDNYANHETISDLPRKLTEGSGPFCNERPGDLCYYAPWYARWVSQRRSKLRSIQSVPLTMSCQSTVGRFGILSPSRLPGANIEKHVGLIESVVREALEQKRGASLPHFVGRRHYRC